MTASNPDPARPRGERLRLPPWPFRLAGRQPSGGQGGDVGMRLDEILGQLGRTNPRLSWQIPLVIVILLGLVMFRPYVIIDNGEGGVVFSKITGVAPEPLKPGFHIIVPVIQSVTSYDTKVRTYTMSSRRAEGQVTGDDSLIALTSDGQKVTLDVTVRYALPLGTLPKLHQEIGESFVSRIIRPQARAVVRTICAQHPVQDFTSEEREEIRSDITDRLTELFAASYITLEEVIIAEVQFSEEFQVAVEEKQRALQEAEQMIYAIQEAEGEAQRLITEAQGDAEAIRARGGALQKNPLLIQYEYVGKIAPNVKGLILTPGEVDSISKATDVAVPPAPTLRTELDEVVDFSAASASDLAAQLEADLRAGLEADRAELVDPVAPGDVESTPEEAPTSAEEVE